MFSLTVAISGLLASAMAASAVRKASGDPSSERLRRRLGVSRAGWRAVGILELLAAVGLLIGLAVPPLGVASAGGVGAVMVGAIVLHRRVRLPGAALAAPSAVLLLAASAGVLRVATG